MRRHSDVVRAFTIGFEERGFDESEPAALAAAQLGLEHHVEVLSEQRALELVPRVTEILDEPMADPSVVPTHLLSAFTRGHVKVALGGDGSDELLMGYRTYQALKVAGWLDRIPSPVRSVLARSARRLPDRSGTMYGKGRRFTAGLDIPPNQRVLTRLGAFGSRARGFVHPGIRGQFAISVTGEPVGEIERSYSGASDWADHAIGTYVRAYLQEDILVKVDRASMAASLEVRAPFLDPELIDWVATVEPSMKLRRLTTKHLLRRLMRGRVPDTVIDRPKQGFGAPMDAWFRGPLLRLAEQALDPAIVRAAGLLDAERTNIMLRQHLEGVEDHGNRLWSAVQLQLWHARWIDGRASEAR
jgi:asparagine synthase (glutamine-hydrolysing)